MYKKPLNIENGARCVCVCVVRGLWSQPFQNSLSCTGDESHLEVTLIGILETAMLTNLWQFTRIYSTNTSTSKETGCLAKTQTGRSPLGGRVKFLAGSELAPASG